MPIKRKIFTMIDDEKKVAENEKSKGKSSLLSFTIYMAIVVAVGIALSIFVTDNVLLLSRVYGHSMLPTLHDGDIFLSLRNTENLERGDIVVIGRMEVDLADGQEKGLVKRIIGLPGDVVEVNPDTSEVTINGEALNESYIARGHHYTNDDLGPITVPDGCYFVMGDNRAHSLDSRSKGVGFVSQNEILGRYFLHVWPLWERE